MGQGDFGADLNRFKVDPHLVCLICWRAGMASHSKAARWVPVGDFTPIGALAVIGDLADCTIGMGLNSDGLWLGFVGG